MSNTKPGFGSRRNLILIWAFAALVAVGYTIYWAVVANQIEKAVQAAISSTRGVVVEEIGIKGWPYRHTLVLTNPSYENADGLAVAAGDIQLTASGFDPYVWMLDHVTAPVLGLPGGPRRTITTTDLRASVRLSSTGLKRVSITLAKAQAAGVRPDDKGWAIGQSAAHLLADEAAVDRFGLSLEASNLRLTQEPSGPAMILGDTINQLIVRGPISQAGSFATSLEDWQQKDGRFEIMVGDLTWGPLQLRNTTGTLQPDPQGRWQGALATTGALVPQGVGFEGLSRSVDASIKDGLVSAYGLPLLTLPDAF